MDNLPSVQPLKGSRFNSIWKLFSKHACFCLGRGEVKKKKKRKRYFVHRLMTVYVLAAVNSEEERFTRWCLKGEELSIPVTWYFLCQGQDTGCLIPFKGKEITWHKSFAQEGVGGGGVRRYTEHEWALHSTEKQAENRSRISSISLWSMNWSANQAPYSKSRLRIH